MKKPLLKTLAVFAAVLLAFPGCRLQSGGDTALLQPPAGEYRAFGPPERVTIRGYQGDAMEPFITKDGRYLLFNNRNDPHTNTNLRYAERVSDLTFKHLGEMRGVNTPVLEAVPSLDRDGTLYFISTRSHSQTLATLYRGHFNGGAVSGVELVGGASLRQRGMVTFDAEISADGNTLFIVDGEFTGGTLPKSADIAIAVREGNGFRRLPESDWLMANVNTAALEYAPAISADLLELFFTRVDISDASAHPGIYRAVRGSTEEPFGVPERVTAITGHAEAPTLTADGRALYYHKLEGDHFVIYRTTR